MKNHCPDNVIDDNSVLIHNDLSLDQFEVNGNPILTQNDTSGSANSFFDSESSQDSSSGDMDGSFSDLSSNDISGDNGFDFTITKDGLSLYYTNADNLMNKIDELKARIHTISPDILVLVEVYPKTGSSMEITAVELNITGYQMYRSKVENRSRGVIIYVSDSLSSSLEVDLTTHSFTESVWVTIRCNNNDTLLLGGIYRSPQSTVENNNLLLDLFGKAKGKQYSNILIIGDFNLPEIDWDLWITSRSENHFSFNFLECVRDNFLEQPVTHPTRWVNDEPGNILDLCFVDNIDIIKKLEITTRLGNSDHLSIELDLNFHSSDNVSNVKRRNYYRGDYITANRKISEVDWCVMEDLDIEQSWAFFSDTVKEIIEGTIPIYKEPKKKSKPPWMDNYCLRLVEQKYKAWKRYTFSRNRADYIKYCEIRNKVTRSVRFAKKKFERGISMEVKDNPKSFWKFVRSKTKMKSGVGDLKNHSGEWITGDKDKADELNSFFGSVFTKNESDELPEFLSDVGSSVCDIFVPVHKVKSMLKSLNISKSTGPDEFHPRFLKETADNIAYPVTVLFNKSIQEGRLPHEWKLANVTCIFKSGDKTQASNYRPISITSILCRMLENIIKSVIMDHCNDNHVFSDSQYGFRQRRGCILQLLKVFDDWTKFVDSDIPVDAIFLDFRKAFDCVPHKRLLMKLEKLGISGNILKWIADFLTERNQRVIINGVSSEWTEVTSGVPQGSVLGPLLFIMYVNDLPVEVDSFCKLFADDAKLYRDLQNLQDFEAVQDDLNNLCQWTIKWLMFFNIDKCKVMHIGKDNPNFEYEMSDNQGVTKNLTSVEYEKDLGIHFQDNLKFDRHISLTVNRANRLVGLIKRAFSFLNKETLLTLYKTLIRPILDYGNTVWFPTLKKDIRAIENVQRRVTKILPELSSLIYEDRLRELRLSTLLYRRRRMDLIQVFKIIENIDDISMNGLFEFCDTQTRGHSKKLIKPRSLKSVRLNSFCVRTIDRWNELPEDIINSKTVLRFKTLLDRYLNDSKYRVSDIY